MCGIPKPGLGFRQTARVSEPCQTVLAVKGSRFKFPQLHHPGSFASHKLELGKVEDAVADLEEAFARGDRTGCAAVARLRTAIAAAQLPEPQRSVAWRSALEAALDAAPLAPEVASARRLLGWCRLGRPSRADPVFRVSANRCIHGYAGAAIRQA